MVPFTAKLRIPDAVLIQTVDGESVLLDLDEQCYYGLDATGTRMWELLTTGDSIDAAYRALLEEFDVAPERLRADLEQLVESLVASGLLHVEAGAAVPGGGAHE